MCLGIKATTGEVIVGDRNGVWLTRIVRKKTAKERCERSNLQMYRGARMKMMRKWTEKDLRERSC